MNYGTTVGELIYAFYSKKKRPDGGYYVRMCKSVKAIREAYKQEEVFINCKRAAKADLKLLGKCTFAARSDANALFEQIRSKLYG
jgi:hypothetical protein